MPKLLANRACHKIFISEIYIYHAAHIHAYFIDCPTDIQVEVSGGFKLI